VCAKEAPVEDSSKQLAKNSFRLRGRLIAVHLIVWPLECAVPRVRPRLRVRNRLTAKTITSPDINEDATDWRQLAAELMVVDLISTVRPTGGGSPRYEW
jgi:hypothetical protein